MRVGRVAGETSEHTGMPHRVLAGVCGSHAGVVAVGEGLFHGALKRDAHVPLHKVVDVALPPGATDPHPGFAVLVARKGDSVPRG